MPTPTQQPFNAPSSIGLELQSVARGLTKPVAMANAGDGSGRLFIVEQPGRIRIVQQGTLLEQPFLDITDRVGDRGNEQGLLGLAFDPAYSNNGFFYVNYTGRQGHTNVARFSVTSDPNLANASSEERILLIEQPAGNHNGGHLVFGPDGLLYIGTGDGGASGDRFGHGQNGQTLLGAMLRLDVRQMPYAIPPDNPFVGNGAVRDEIWAIGLRNPWRYSFDQQTGDLYIGDVGQNRFEEVHVVPAGSQGGLNFGWPIMEGANCYPENRACDRTGLEIPVVEYDHAQGCSITGGYVYRGGAYPVMSGIYLFGDYCSGRIWGLAQDPSGAWQVAELAQTGRVLSTFGEDEAGELYLLDMGQGELLRIAAQ
jgi:glucose/arabinose dehydrogenase